MAEKDSVFEELAKPLRKLLEERGFEEPTLPQRKAFLPILNDNNTLLIAPAGTGKTEAAFLPILNKILRTPRSEGIKLIYITPLRALNRDILDRLRWWCKALDLKVSVRHGDTSKRERRKQALSPPDVLITTPETFQLLLVGKRISRHATYVDWVIVDEVHELAGNKRGAQLSLSLERMRRLKGGDFQIIGLSATVGSPEEVAKFLVGVNRPYEIVDVSMAREIDLDVLYPNVTETDETLASEIYTYPEVTARLRKMRELIEDHETTLIFTNTRPMSEVLASRFKMWDLDFPVSVHHGSLSTFARRRVEDELKTGKLKGVICTSSMELGIDIGLVDLCIQYNSPRQVARLLQRVGRSGHKITKKAKGRIIVKDSTDGMESSVIIDKSEKKELEPVKIPEKPLDVLSHELVGMLVAEQEWRIDDALSILNRAYPFRNLEEEDVIRVLKFLEDMSRRLAWLRDDELVFSRPSKGKRIFNYYFNSLSMIPEMKQYLVIDDTSDEAVGVLDEPFVAEYGEPGSKFVMSGSIWRIVQVFKDKVFVKPVEDPVGSVPSWVGEEIPVPHSVAQKVGSLRRRLANSLEKGKDYEEAVREISQSLDLDRGALKKSLEPIKKHSEEDFPVPTDDRIVLEKAEDTLVVHACFGTLANRTLARFIAKRAADELGESVAVTVDPYRILIRSERLSPKEIKAILTGEMGQDFQKTLETVIEDSRFFKWRIVQIGRRIGTLDKETDMTASDVDQMVKGMKDTPVYDETFKEVVRKDLDLPKALDILNQIVTGELQLSSIGILADPSPIAEPAWEERSLTFEPVSPKRMKRLILGSVRARLLSEERAFACAECKDWVEVKEIHELSEPPSCQKCGSRKIGMIEREIRDIRRTLDRVKENSKKGKESEIWKIIQKTSKLVSNYGKTAAAALVGKGIKPSAAERILEKEEDISDEFLDLIINEEKKSLRHRYGSS
ncbi:hypothetical protein AKJ51_02020 [candidate division MSBL1 archaeon SCGC-AAA382A20]|uniref:ATP-dependent helicase n=1 Tax=candidate division MSBL1 archaeon SCGC-AAA382A20 TaxID=1698280 RepID=A0A133VKY9_9EURY|nr:hypothetical protein AKJ51_02020 [candidate division MSBL1 archaeon SCGC-AAA382A20]